MLIQKVSQKVTGKVLTSRTVLNTLEKISEHGTSFSAGTSLVLSLAVRPFAINSTPNVEKENKQYAMANSICSGLIKFAMVEAIALPIEYAVKRIDKNPQNYLKISTISKLSNGKALPSSKSYKLITQMIKLSTGFITAIPKSVLTIALIPVVMDNLFRHAKPVAKDLAVEDMSYNYSIPMGKNVTFSGLKEGIPKGVGKIIDSNLVQNFAEKHQNQEKDIAKHMTAATDTLLTATSVYQTAKSKNIDENRKHALIYNNIIMTAVTLIGGYTVDKLFKNKSDKFIEKFKQLNAADPKLSKYVEGINIVRPALIFAGIYYGILPIFSTYFAERIDKFASHRQNNPLK